MVAVLEVVVLEAGVLEVEVLEAVAVVVVKPLEHLMIAHVR